MTRHLLKIAAAAAAALALGACSNYGMAPAASTTAPAPATARTATGDNQPEPTILMVPVQVTDQRLASGCWAQFYSQRNFQGDMLTLVGPAQVQSLDRGTALQLRREIDSIVIGPRATLQVYENAMFLDRTVTLAPNTREGGLITKLGFRGRIEALRLTCS